MKKQTLTHVVLLTGVLLGSGVACAATRSIAAPVSGDYVDTESSLNVPLADWPDLGRRVRIDLSAYATPSNAIQIAFGQDTNGDEDLEPEETWLVIGIDCGVPFVREEEGVENRCRCRAEFDNSASLNAGQQGGEATSSSLQQEEGDHHSSTSTLNFNFRQPQAVSKRISFAKVTTRGREDTAAQIAAEIHNPGIVLLVR